MNRSLRRTSGLAVLLLATTLGLAACGSDSGDADEVDTTVSMAAADTADTAETIGAGCSALPESGPGSLEQMATDPVATAASGNPMLQTLVTALEAAAIDKPLDGVQGITLFAPTNDAFAQLPAADLEALLADPAALTQVLAYHVVPGRLSPDELVRSHRTLESSQLVVDGAGDTFAVGSGGASVLCGNIQTENATVYVIDAVLLP